MSSTHDSIRRFAGVERLYGGATASRIRSAHVVVVGIGGVGSWAAEALARSGVGELTLIDLDHVAESNINRQIHATDLTLGMAKIDAMRERIHSYNSEAKLHTVDEFVTPENVALIVPQSAQVIIDACDQVRAKVALAALAKDRGVACVMSGAAGGKLAPQLIEVADLVDVTHDRLLASVRARLRREHSYTSSPQKKMQVPCVFSREPVRISEDCDPEAKLACAGYGSSVMVTASFGMTLASLALEAISKC